MFNYARVLDFFSRKIGGVRHAQNWILDALLCILWENLDYWVAKIQKKQGGMLSNLWKDPKGWINDLGSMILSSSHAGSFWKKDM